MSIGTAKQTSSIVNEATDEASEADEEVTEVSEAVDGVTEKVKNTDKKLPRGIRGMIMAANEKKGSGGDGTHSHSALAFKMNKKK
jgi:uncharacterized coiled-coil DUF342 family protein